MHANVGCTQDASDALERRIEAVAAKRGERVTVVGHSLGGLLARGVAVRRPDLVDGLVTLGSPLLAPGAVHPVLAFDLALVTALRRAGLGRMMGRDCTSGECARLSWERSRGELDPSVAFTVFDVVTEALGVPGEPPQTGATPDVTAATSGAAPVASAG